MPETIKRPMLAPTGTADIKKIKYPVLASPKFDGIRCLKMNGQLMSRSFKPIRNEFLQKMFVNLPEGMDGELIADSPTEGKVYRKTVKAVMKKDGDPSTVKLYVFDNYKLAGGFQKRFESLPDLLEASFHNNVPVVIVKHTLIHNAEEMAAFEEECVNQGYEGAMARSLNGPYKENRSSEKEGYLLKIKRFEDAEAVILGSEEGEHNTNEAKKDALGHTVRSDAKAGKVPTGWLGKLLVRGLNGAYEGKEYEVGNGFELEERKELWKDRPALIGKVIKVKYAAKSASGGYDLPRFPIFLGFRDADDME